VADVEAPFDGHALRLAGCGLALMEVGQHYEFLKRLGGGQPAIGASHEPRRKGQPEDTALRARHEYITTARGRAERKGEWVMGQLYPCGRIQCRS